eukprot:2826123-Rhodomonas_salina.3
MSISVRHIASYNTTPPYMCTPATAPSLAEHSNTIFLTALYYVCQDKTPPSRSVGAKANSVADP